MPFPVLGVQVLPSPFPEELHVHSGFQNHLVTQSEGTGSKQATLHVSSKTLRQKTGTISSPSPSRVQTIGTCSSVQGSPDSRPAGGPCLHPPCFLWAPCISRMQGSGWWANGEKQITAIKWHRCGGSRL